MKIYCLLIDAMPESSELQKFAKDRGFNFSKQIANCFTTTTLYNMFTGMNSSDLVQGGAAYHFVGNPEIKDCRWHKDESIHLVDICRDNGLDFIACSRLPFLARDILNSSYLDGSVTYDQSKQNHIDTYFDFSIHEKSISEGDRFSHVTTVGFNPDGTKNLFWEGYKDLNLRNQFFANQQKWISQEQKTKKNGFYFYQNLSWSDHKWGSQLKNKEETTTEIFDWLNMWDFEEEDSCFWIFSDHGDNADDLMTPKSYLSWVMVKDNTSNSKNSETIRPVISSMDFYKFARDKITDEENFDYPISEDIYAPINRERLYFLEDGRMHTDLNYLTAASTVGVGYEEDAPKTLLQVVYHKISKQTLVFELKLDDTAGQLYSAEYEKVKHMGSINALKESLFNRFDWLL